MRKNHVTKTICVIIGHGRDKKTLVRVYVCVWKLIGQIILLPYAVVSHFVYG